MRVITAEEYFKKKKNGENIFDDDIAPVRSNNGAVDIRDLVTVNGGTIKDFDTTVKAIDDLYQEQKKQRKWLDFGAFEDGYQIGDVTKAIGGTALNFGVNLARGSAMAGEKLVELGAGGVAQISDWLGNDELAENIRGKIAGKNENYNKFMEKYGVSSNFNKMSNVLDGVSITGEKLDDLTASVGQLLAGASLGNVGANIVMFGSSAGGELGNAYKNGATDGEAWLSAFISGASEVLFEKLSGGIKFGGGTLDDFLPINALTDKIANKTVQTLTKFGIDAVGEGFEEVLTEVASNVGRKLTYEDEQTWKQILASDEALDSYLEAFIGGALMGGGFNTGKAINSIKTGRNYTTGFTANEQLVLDKEIEARVKEATKDNKKLSNKELNKIKEEAKSDLQKGYISTGTIESTLGGETYKNLQNQKSEVESIKKEIKKLQSKKMSEMSVGEYNDSTAQIKVLQERIEKLDTKTLEEQLNSEMEKAIGSDDYLKRSYYEDSQKGVNFEADLSTYDDKQKAVIQKAIDSGILNNTTKTHEFVDMIAKLSADKGVTFDFTNNKKLKGSSFAVKGKTVNGFVNSNGDITLNIDSNKALNSVVGHEITHVLEGTELYTELQQAVKNYSMAKGDYNKRLKALQNTYKNIEGANIENELTADLVGDYLFTDTDFVRQLSTEKPNLFKKIYNEIKYLVKIATAGSKEARQLEKVKKAFEDAYREGSKQTKQQSIKDNKKLYKYTKENKMLVSATDNLAEILESGVFDAKRTSVGSYDKGTAISEYGKYKVHLKPEALDYVDKMYKGDGGTRSEFVKENTETFNNVEDLINNHPQTSTGQATYDELTFKNDVPTDLIEKVEIPKGTDQSVIDMLDSKGIPYEFYTPKQKSNTDEDGLLSMFGKKTQKESTTDNQGRELSKEQKDFFKDSKVRDENGNLLAVYHGTRADFNVFDKNKAGDNYENGWSQSGKGFYFTDNQTEAQEFGDYSLGDADTQVKEVYLNITNPFDASQEGTIELAEIGADYDVDPQFTQRGDYLLRWFRNNGIDGTEVLKKYGYDGIIDYGHYVAFDSNQIKNVDNTKPTFSEDIRYSLSDNTGRELSEGQREYFKDSKARDDNGSLVTVYHTTTDGGSQFNEFNPVGTPGYRFGDQVVNYYTDSKEMSSSYAGNYSMADTSKFTTVAEVTEWLDNNKENDQILYTDIEYEIVPQANGKIGLFVEDVYEVPNSFVKTYTDEEFIRNAKDDILKKYGHKDKRQYEGYANITNPYVIDAEGRYWNTVKIEPSQKITDFFSKLTPKQKEIIDDFGNGKWASIDVKVTECYRKMYAYKTKYQRGSYEYELAKLGKQLHDTFTPELQEGYLTYEAFNKLGMVASRNYSPEVIKEIAINPLSTNDIVKRVIEENKNGANYDGVIIKNVIDYGGFSDVRTPADLYVTFASNQFKAVDNLNPTDDADIRYSLSETGKTGTLEDIMPNSELVKNSIDVTNYKTNYENVPDNLLGFRKNGQNKGYFEEKYKYNLDLLISVDGGKTYFEDSIKGLNYNQAIERAKRNWGEDAILKVKPSSNKDIRYSLSDVDSELEPLTDEQREYFKDTVVKDIDNELEVVYHGTPNDFTIFDINKSALGQYGIGLYFTNEQMTSQAFTDGSQNILKGYLNIKKPASRETITIPFGDFKKLYNDLANNPTYVDEDGESIIDFVLSNYGDIYSEGVDTVLRKFYDAHSNDSDLIDDLAYKTNKKEILYDTIRKVTGIDGLVIEKPGGAFAYEKYYIAFNPDQFKLKSNQNPTDNPDIRYSLSEDASIEDKINASMTMAEAKKMIQIAFQENRINDWREDGEKYIDGDDWLNDVGVDEVATYIDNTHSTILNYTNPLYDKNIGFGEDYYTESILEAYQNGTLTGMPKEQATRLDTSISSDYQDDRFYSPREVQATLELYNKANQRVTKTNSAEVYKARADFIIATHQKGVAEQLGLTQQEVNKKVKAWANYTDKARNLSNQLNENVSLQNRWSGLENSSIVNTISVTSEDLSKMVKEIKGDSGEWQRQYITSTMLALDTHIDYSKLTFEFDQHQALRQESALGDYNRRTKTIRIGDGYQNTVAHEIGHYIDNKWAEDFGFLETYNLTDDLNFEATTLSDEAKQFNKNFQTFMNDLVKSATVGYGSKTNYYQSRSEVFARFVGRFVEWTKNQATNNRYGYENKYYEENFTESQYREFVKLLQEKAMLDTTAQYSLSNPNDIAPVRDNNLTYGEDVRIEQAIAPIQDEIATLTESINKLAEQIAPVQETPVQEVSNAEVTEDVAPVGNVPVLPPDNAQIGDGDIKQRKWVETSTESDVVNRQILPDDLDERQIYYQVKTNAKTLETANNKLNTLGYEESVTYFNNQLMNKRASVEDIALGERLIQEAIKKGDKVTASELIQNVAILGTELGQKVQALSIIKRMTPEGQLRMIDKTIKRAKAKEDVVFKDVELTQEMKNKILDVYNEDGSYDQDELNRVIEEVKQELANQMPTTAMEKVNAWRYLSMLGNPKTHIRNLVSNVAMKGTLAVKNAMARTIESVVPIKERTKTWKKTSDVVNKFADDITLEMKDIINGDSKYSEEADIKAKRDTFKNKVLNKVYNFNSDLLEAEDWWFSKSAFKNSFAEYLTANGISTEADIESNPEIIEKAKNYALEQSQIATFRQYSWLANKIRDIESKNVATQVAVGSIIPFKKTPINIAKAGLSYSPLGFAKTLTYDIAQVKKGRMEASTLIDHLAQNTTGTALTLIGYMLASAGFLNGGGEDDKEGSYDYQLGEQAYSITIDGHTYSLSWLSPVAMPLFVGANAYEQLVEGKELDGNVIVETLAQTLDPLSEMSFLSGLDQVLSSYDSGMEKFAGIFQSMGQNYITQFIPTLSSQVASTFDDTKRSTKASGDSGFKFAEETYNKIAYKIPGLRNTLEPSTDIWGNEAKQNENIIGRAFDNFIAPYSRREIITSDIDYELKDLYAETGENGLLPNIPSNYINYKNEKYKMSAEEHTQYKKTYGQTAHDLLEELFETTTYQNAEMEDKVDMVEKVYDYARDTAKKEYLEGRDVEYTNATKNKQDYYKENSIKDAIKNDVSIDEMNYAIKNPSNYAVVSQIGSYEEYVEYKDAIDEIKEAYKTPDGATSKQKTAYSNQRKQAVQNYINSLNLSIPQKIMLQKMAGGYSVSSYKNYMSGYIESLPLSAEEKRTIHKELFD